MINAGAESRDTILDSINEGVFTVDAAWRITSFNAAAENITGVSRDQAIGQRCFEVFHANICETACALRRTMADGKPMVNATAYIVNQASTLFRKIKAFGIETPFSDGRGKRREGKTLTDERPAQLPPCRPSGTASPDWCKDRYYNYGDARRPS